MAFFLALAVVATRPLAFDLRGATLAGPDPRTHLWTLHWLTGHVFEPARLFDGNVFAPFPRAVLHADLSLGTAVLALPLRLFVHEPVLLFNLSVLLTLAFTGWAFHALVRGLGGRLDAALLSGTLAAFGSHQLCHAYHLNLLSIGWLALFLLALHRLLAEPSVRAVLLAGVAFALTALSSGYYAVAATFVAIVFAAWHVRRFTRKALLAACTAALLAGALVAPYVQGYAALRHDTQLRRPPGLAVRMAFQPARDLGSRAYLDAALVGAGPAAGEKFFPGVAALALALWALARRRPHAGFYAVAAGTLLVFSLGPRLDMGALALPLPYAWLSGVPPFHSMRHPYTFAAVAVLLVAVLAGLGLSALPARARRFSAPLLLALAVAETIGPPLDVRPVPAGLPPAYEAVRRRAPGVILELPMASPDAMVWAARHGLPVVNGISAFAPAETLRLQNVIQREWHGRRPVVDESLPVRLMREVFGVRYLIVPASRPAFRRLAPALDASRAFVRLESFADGSRLYELRAEPTLDD